MIFFCTTLVIDPRGDIIGQYRKKHICDVELPYFQSGNKPPLFLETIKGNIGIHMCFDRHFSDVVEYYQDLPVDLIFVPCSTASEKSRSIWVQQVKDHASTTGANIAFINRVGIDVRDVQKRFFGQTIYAAPNGEILGMASNMHEEILLIPHK